MLLTPRWPRRPCPTSQSPARLTRTRRADLPRAPWAAPALARVPMCFTQLSLDPATWARQLLAVALPRGWQLQLSPTLPVGKSFHACFHSCFVYSGHEFFSPEPGAAPALGGVSRYCHAKAVAITVLLHHHQQLHLQVPQSSQKSKGAGFMPSSLPARLRLLVLFDSRLTMISSKAGKSFSPNSWRQTWDGRGVPDDANTLFYLCIFAPCN